MEKSYKISLHDGKFVKQFHATFKISMERYWQQLSEILFPIVSIN